jgi:hypothetical protein
MYQSALGMREKDHDDSPADEALLKTDQFVMGFIREVCNQHTRTARRKKLKTDERYLTEADWTKLIALWEEISLLQYDILYWS